MEKFQWRISIHKAPYNLIARPQIVTHILQKAFWGHALTQPKQAPPGAICFYHLKHIALRGFFYLGIFLYAFLKEGKKRNIEL